MPLIRRPIRMDTRFQRREASIGEEAVARPLRHPEPVAPCDLLSRSRARRARRGRRGGIGREFGFDDLDERVSGEASPNIQA